MKVPIFQTGANIRADDELIQDTIAENTALRTLLSDVCETWGNDGRVLDRLPGPLAHRVRLALGMPSVTSSENP